MSERRAVHTYLTLSRDSQVVRVIVWDLDEIRVGRHLGQDIVLTNPEISRAHARLLRDGERFVVEDLETANGTFVNGERIHSTGLAPNDRIQIGEWTIRFSQSLEDPAGTHPEVAKASELANDRGRAGAEEESPPVRDLAAALEEPDAREKDDPPPIQPPTEHGERRSLAEQSSPLAGLDFDLGTPTPPVGQEDSEESDFGTADAVESDFSFGSLEEDSPSGQDVEIRLCLEGADPELVRLLQSLRGRRFDLRALSLLLSKVTVRD